MPILQFEVQSDAEFYDLDGMAIHDAPRHRGMARLVLPEHTLVVKTQQMAANLRWEGIDMGDSSWAPGDVGLIPAKSEMITRIWGENDNFRATLVRLDHGVVEGVVKETALDVGSMHYTQMKGTMMAPIATSLVGLIGTGVLEQHRNVAESLSTALAVEAVKAMCPVAAKTLVTLKHGLSAERKRRVVECIRENLHRHISLDELAAVAHLSPYHFSRSFKKANNGVGPAAFVLLQRIVRAKQRLRAKTSIAQVALECGFSSQSHFTTAFKGVVGTAPGEYRRQLYE